MGGGKDKNKKPKDADDGSQYSYVTDEENAPPHASEPAAEPQARPQVCMTASKAKAAPSAEEEESSSESRPRR